jgi:hypothetical protein
MNRVCNMYNNVGVQRNENGAILVCPICQEPSPAFIEQHKGLAIGMR